MASRTPVKGPADATSKRVLLLAILAGLVIRLSLLVTTVGTSDVHYKTVWGRLAVKYGTAAAYTKSPYLNEPPLALVITAQTYRWSEKSGLAFGDLYRLLQVFADLGSAVCLALLAMRVGSSPVRPALLFFLSPAAVFVSAFHCNIDPTMLFLTLLSFTLLTRDQPQFVWSGIALGLATGIKIIPLLLAPFVCIAVGRKTARFLIGFLVTVALIFGIPLAQAGPAVWRNIFGYTGLGNWWGFVSVLTALRRVMGDSADATLDVVTRSFIASTQFIVVAAVLALLIPFWRVRRRGPEGNVPIADLMAASAVLFSALLFVASGFGVQYLIWPLPFLPFILRLGETVTVHLVVSAFLAVVYTHWSGGLPWWFANSDAAGATTDAMVYFGWVVWLVLGFVAVLGARRMVKRHQ